MVPASLGLGAEVIFTPAELEYLDAINYTVTMGVDPDWEPFELLHEDGRFTGIAADLVTLVAERLGITFDIVPTKDWGETLAISRVGLCMVLPFLNQTPEREQWLHFTDPLFVDPTVLITHRDYPFIYDLAELEDATIIFPVGTSMEERVRRDFPNLTVVNTDREIEALAAVVNRQADMALRSLTIAAYTIRQEGLINLQIAGRVHEYTNYLRMGVLHSEPLLVDILNKGIATITPLEQQEIVNRHVYVRIEEAVDYSRLRQWIFGFVVVSFLLVALNYHQKQHNLQVRRLSQLIQESYDRYDQLAKQNRTFTWEVNSEGIYTHVSQVVEDVLDFPPAQIVGQMHFHELFHPDDQTSIEQLLYQAMADCTEFTSIEIRQVTCDSGNVWVLINGVPLVDDDGVSQGFRGSNTDITERKEVENKIKAMAFYDTLTQLPNRRLFTELGAQELLDAGRRKESVAVMFADLDRFKQVNDRFGHETGDVVLKTIANRLRTAMRQNDIVARLAGDEFVLLLPGVDAAGIPPVADKLVQCILTPIPIADEAEATVGVSLGIGLYPQDGEEIGELISKADQAMYRAKTDPHIHWTLYRHSPSEENVEF